MKEVGLLENAMKTLTTSAATTPPVYVTSNRRLERFRDKPEKTSDPEINEWIEDVRSQLSVRKLDTKGQALFVIDHLAGKARQEILGRGGPTIGDPEKIFVVLRKIFGIGEELPHLQQLFYSYQQKEKESLLDCSLELLTIYNRICQLDPTFETGRDRALKSRLAEAVRDESLKRELRRLSTEATALSLFDMRDRAIHWLGSSNPIEAPKSTVNQEVAQESAILNLLKQQSEQLKSQQQQINQILSKMKHNPHSNETATGTQLKKKRTCWKCNSPTHFMRDCPVKQPSSQVSSVEQSPAVPPPEHI